MRLVQGAAFTAAAMLLASMVSAQGLGDAAARERAKRKAEPAKKAKVYTESNLPSGAAPVEVDTAEPDATSDAAKPADAKGKETDPEKGAAEAKARAEQEWKAKLEDARKEEQIYRNLVDQLQLDLNDTSSLYTPGRARKVQQLEDGKQKLAAAQSRIAALEAEGQSAGYR